MRIKLWINSLDCPNSYRLKGSDYVQGYNSVLIGPYLRGVITLIPYKLGVKDVTFGEADLTVISSSTILES